MPASVYSRVARKRKFSTLSLRSAVENGSFWPKRTKELFKIHRWKGFSSFVQTSQTYHFLKFACSMPASVYSRVARKRKFSTLSLRSAFENGSFWQKRTKELFKKHRWKGFSSLVQTSKTYHFLKLAPFLSPLTDLIDFGMAGKLLTSATRRCSPFLDSVPRLWLNPKKSLIACWAPTAATFVQSSPSWVQLTAGHNCRNRHFDRPSLVSLVCRSVCTRKIELYLLWAAYFRGVLPWLQRTTVKSAGFSCMGTISRVIVKVTSSSNLEKYACADFDDGVFFERSTNSSDSAL